tara:strand:+ start:321 stop:536 length:216 start_codon:yes stop_codon:yes gene_type:complete
MYKSCKKCGSSKGGKLVVHTECGNSGCNQGGVRAAERNSCEDRIIEINSGGGKTCRACGKIIYGLDKVKDL